MVEVVLYEGPNDEWDADLNGEDQIPFLQSNSWAEVKSLDGWHPCRLLISQGDTTCKVLAFVQVKFNLGIIWITDPSIYICSSIARSIVKVISQTIGATVILLRVNILKPEFRGRGINDMRPAKFPLNSGYSFVLDLCQPHELIVKNLSKNWKRNLKRADARSIELKELSSKNSNEVFELMENSMRFKKMKSPYSKSQIDILLDAQNVKAFGAYLGNDLVAVRACGFGANKSIDLIAGSNKFGKKYYANYLLIWTLIQKSKSLGKTYYDLAGYDLDDKSGVYNFKRGTGATNVKYEGEFNYSPYGMILPFLDLLVYLKSKI